MASKALMANIKESNESFLSRARLEMHDFQFDHDADILYVAIGESTEAFSVPLESMGEQVYLRVEVGTFKIVGLDIMRFKQAFLANDPHAKKVFDPIFGFFGDSDWRFQAEPRTGQVSVFVPPAHEPAQYLDAYIPRVAPDLVPA